MRITKETALFFDASVLVAGAGSPEGGSALLLEACGAGGFRGLVSIPVVLEAGEAVRELVGAGHFFADAMVRFHRFLGEIAWEVAGWPAGEELTRASQLIEPGDAHVLASALESGCDFLVTLDVRHFKTEELEAADLPFEIVTPGEFIQGYYHLHEDYPELPPSRG